MWYLIIKNSAIYFGKNKNKKQEKGMELFETEKEMAEKLYKLTLEYKNIKIIRTDIN